MFCPKCAAQNLDDAKYCRACGADISLVPQAVTGQLAERLAAAESEIEGSSRHQRRRGKGPPSIERAIVQMFMGAAFLIVALALSMSSGGNGWWFYMLIPAFIFLGNGVGAFVRISQEKKKLTPPPYIPAATPLQPPPRVSALPPRNTGELVEPPPSVTEATTRHLGIPVERKPKDV